MQHFTSIMTSYTVWDFVTWFCWLIVSLESSLREYQFRVHLCIVFCILLYKTVKYPAQIKWRTIFHSKMYREWMRDIFCICLYTISPRSIRHYVLTSNTRGVDNENACDASGCNVAEEGFLWTCLASSKGQKRGKNGSTRCSSAQSHSDVASAKSVRCP